MTAAQGGKRLAYLDALRIIAAFLVIVNHTNSAVFLSLTPSSGQWWISILWYYISKIAVPVFVMITGACLLGRVDGYRKTLMRIIRALLAMLLIAYIVFLDEAWVLYGLWPRAVDFGTFFARVWRLEILDDYWYIYVYVGLLAMLPFLQRMARSMRSKDILLFAGLCFAFGGAYPLITHYLPALNLPPYSDAPLFSSFIGCLFMGFWLREHYAPTRRANALCCALFAGSLAASVYLTYAETLRVGIDGRYLFMDARDNPSIFMLIGAVCVFAIAKSFGSAKPSRRRNAVRTELGGCTFAVYLLQGFIIEKTRRMIFDQLCSAMPPFAAVLCWELCVFAVCVAAAWLMRRVPFVKKLL